ncbi:MAG: hypothetical protein ACHQ2Z_10860, partial [Elusimicrobiota bacterium]
GCPALGPARRRAGCCGGGAGRPPAPPPGSIPEAPAAPANDAAESASAAKARAGVPFGEGAASPRSDAVDAVAPAVSGAAAAAALVPSGRLSGLVAAESRVRSSAKSGVRASAKSRVAHLRLLQVSVDLTADAPRWTFTYDEPVRQEILTYGPEGVASRKYKGREKPAMLRKEELSKVDLDRALESVQAENPGFKPVRAEVVPDGEGFAATFIDALGISVTAPASAAAEPHVAAPAEIPAPAAEPSAEPVVPAAAAPAAAPSAAPDKHVYEGAFGVRAEDSKALSFVDKFMGVLGFRTVRGVVHDPALGRLPAGADVPRILAQFAEFEISREKALELGKAFHLDETSPRAKWLEVYDSLKTRNTAAGKRFDSAKYEGELPVNPHRGMRGVAWRLSERFKAYIRFETGSYRQLANRTYEPGWRGAARRVAGLQKYLVGFAFRVPYHLFDMFIFGYFRQAITFEFFHDGEDFLALSQEKNLAEKYLAAAMQKQYFGGSGYLAGLRSRDWFRGAERWFVTPLAKPLVTFIVRRLTLAIMSSVALGVFAAFAPALPISFALTSLPFVVTALNSLPVLTAAIPFVGHFFAPVVSAAVGALAKQLVLGPLIQTFILSTFLTFPRAVGDRLAQARDKHPMLNLTPGERFRAVAGAAVSWQFWRSNLKSFVGMATVNAEISGILTYASQVDAGISRVTGRQFGGFHSIGAAVDGQNGAISWGSVLLYKLQAAVGWNISDNVMHATQDVKKFIGARAATDAAGASAAAIVHAAEAHGGAATPFDENLWKKSPAEAAARIKALAASAGGVAAEVAAVKDHMRDLQGRLGNEQARFDSLVKQRDPVTPAEKAEFERLSADLGAKRDASYVQSKLSEAASLKNPKANDAAELKDLLALQAKYKVTMPPPPPDRNGYWEQLATQEASFKALSARLNNYKTNPGSPGAPAGEVDPALKEKIEKLVGEIEAQRTEIQGEMTQRDATASLIKAANQIRKHALDERRNGQDMLRFHTDFSKLSTVMDLALSLNEISAAMAAIAQMENLLQAKQAAVNAANQQNQQNAAAAAANQALVAQWTAQNQATVTGDQTSQASMANQEVEASMAATRAAGFQQQISGLIAAINAMDKGSSPDAATQYAKDLNLLSQVAQWRTSGNPNDPTQFSLQGLQADLTEVNTNLAQAKTGLTQIAQAPVEFAGALIIAVPGPQVNVTNPTPAQTLAILAARKTYWQAELATKQGNLTTVNNYMDPNYIVVDEFGLGHGYNKSLTNMATLHPSAPAAGSKADAQADLAQLDKIAGELNGLTGSHIPLLSGLSLTDLQTAIKGYGDALKAVKFPTSTGTVPPAVHQGEMDLILAAQLTPMAARAIVNWSVDQATVDTFNTAKAPGGALTVAQAGLTSIVNMLNNIINDVSVDQALVQAHSGGNPLTQAEDLSIIARKTALLNDPTLGVVPVLTQAQSMLGSLITYQQGSIADVTGNNSQYYTLFSSEQLLMTQTQQLYNQTLPWSLASFGGSYGDIPGSLASLANWKQSLNQYITGYTDSNGQFQEGITQYQQDMKDRQCTSGCTRSETLYGETQPYSLPMKISQYGTEATTRANEINTQDAKINQILKDIQTLSNGQYNLSAYTLPVGIGTDAASQAKIQAIIDANTIQNLGNQLKTIGNAALANGGGQGPTINTGGSGTVPVGTQPSPTVSNQSKIALEALAAAELLVPSANSQVTATSAPEAFAVARYEYANAVVSASQTALTTQVPQAVTFLQQASAALGAAIAQTTQDAAYINSNGSSETPDALYARKIAMFNQLDSFLKQGQAFYVLKTGWDQGTFATITKIGTYYNSLNTIYTNGSTVNASETTAINTMLNSLYGTSTTLQQTQQKVQAWMSQLDPKQQSALKRVSDDVSTIQDKTRAVLDANINWHDLDDQMKRSRSIVAAGLAQVDVKQKQLAELLKKSDVQGRLDPDLVKRIKALRVSGGTFALGGAGADPQALVIKKSEFSAFLDTMLGMLKNGTESLATQQTAAMKTDLMANPNGLAAFMPGSGVMDFGDSADGFYLVYQSKFSVPNGLDTGSWVTLGNVAKLWGNNISINGYGFSSPPSDTGAAVANAPYGDKGIEVQVESLQNRSSVNYLNVDIHRFGLDLPANDTPVATAAQNRLMVFDDYAMMLLGDRLYVGLAGYGDVAMSQPGDNPYYYGGNLKTSLKLTEVMSLNASQQVLFANDPRHFLENINLDFTGYDPSLNQNFAVMAQGDNKYYSRTQVGPHFDINRLMHPDGGGDTFTVDVYYAKTAGTDDIAQQAAGTTIVKGFSIKNDQGKTWLQINNSANAELGQVANTFGDTLSFTLPDKGITISGQGQLIGGQSIEYGQISKKMGTNTAISLGYGSQYVGETNRLSLTMNTSITLAQVWDSVSKNSAKNLKGGETLQQFNTDIGELFDAKDRHSTRSIAELKRVFDADVSRKLITQDIGTLTRDIQDLRKAGAFMDNTRVRGMVGFTSNAASNDQAELAVGGGPTAGTFTEMTLSKTQKALIQNKTASLYREGLHLQDRLLDITKDWQEAVVDIAQAQWNLRLARFEADRDPRHATSEAVRAEADVRVAAAQDALHEAVLRYNAMTGRDPSDLKSPFEDLNAQDLRELMDGIAKEISAPDRYTRILGALDQGGRQMLNQYAQEHDADPKKADKEDEAALAAQWKRQYGGSTFNLVDWLPFVDKLTVGFGVQYQDMMNGQALTLGGSVRLPIYDPSSKDANKSYIFDSKATLEEMGAVYRQRAVRAAGEREKALAWQATTSEIEPQGPAADQRAMDAIRQYRNGLISADQLRAAFDSWRWYASMTLQAQSQASLADVQAAMDEDLAPKWTHPAPGGLLTISSLEEAFNRGKASSHDLQEVADRAAAADEMRKAEDHRIQKFWLDLEVGSGLTSKGPAWIPTIGITGIPVTPIFGMELKPEELRELQVSQHTNQKAYYDKLYQRLQAGVATQFYQDFLVYESAQKELALYQDDVLPKLQLRTKFGTPDEQANARLILDKAYLDRDDIARREATALAGMNLLIGRKADAPLAFDMTPEQ